MNVLRHKMLRSADGKVCSPRIDRGMWLVIFRISLYDMNTTTLPRIIQGGMGVGISGWRLARAVSMHGQLGVVSATAADALMARVLEDGDPGGHVRRALERFPIASAAERILREHYRPNGRDASTPYRSLGMMHVPMSTEREALIMAASFVEVWLAKDGHDAPVGINLLTKVQLPTAAALYGAMLAGVDVVIMGAGIPREIPGMLDRLSLHRDVSMRLDVAGLESGASIDLTFSPERHDVSSSAPLHRPAFLAIISSNSLATMLQRRSTGRIDGFVVEAPTAGGHNAPPRGEVLYASNGEPTYTDRDKVDLEALRSLGLPFWLAGGTGHPGALAEAIANGAAGIQIGTLMAFCDESGMAPELRRRTLEAANEGRLSVYTDPRASPTGYPFKIVEFDHVHMQAPPRTRRCDLGYLRTAYVLADGRIAHRCSAEPVATYVAKGGRAEETTGRRCLCNALLATAGHGQRRRDGSVEEPIITAGDQARDLAAFLNGRTSYAANDVLQYLLS